MSRPAGLSSITNPLSRQLAICGEKQMAFQDNENLLETAVRTSGPQVSRQRWASMLYKPAFRSRMQSIRSRIAYLLGLTQIEANRERKSVVESNTLT